MSPNENAVAPVVDQDLLTRLNAFLRNASQTVARNPVGTGLSPGMPALPAEMPADASDASLSMLGKNIGTMVAPAGKEESFGTIGQNFAESVPRMVATGASGGIPGMAADMVLSGYGGAREHGAGDVAAVTSGALSGAAGLAMPIATELGANVAAQALAKSPIVNETAQRVGEFLGGQAAQLGVVESNRQAQSVLSGEGFQNPLTAEHAFETALTTLPFSVIAAKGELAPEVAMGADGVPNIPMTRTQTQRYVNALRARQAGEKAFTDDATPTQNLIEGPPGARPEQNVTDTGDSVNDILRPQGDGSSSAHDSFVKAAGLDSNVEPVMGSPEASLAKNVPGVNVVGEQGPAAPFMQVDFGDPKQVTPTLILDKLLAGEITPIGTPEGKNNVALVEDLKRAFVAEPSQRGESFVDMTKVMDSAHLAQTILSKTASPEDAARWETFNTAEKTASIAAAKILQDPYAVMGKDPVTGGLPQNRWSVQSATPYLRVVHNAAGSLYKKWDKPVTSAADAGAMVRDVNFFTQNVLKGLEAEVGPEALKQLSTEGNLKPVTLEGIQQQYDAYITEYLHSPDDEAAARVMQTVRNKILLAAGSAKEAMLASPKYSADMQQPSTESQRAPELDYKLDKEYQDAVGKLAPDEQARLNKLYTEARGEVENKASGEAYWKLDNFRDQVIGGKLPASIEDVKPSRVLDSRMGGFKPTSLDAGLEKTESSPEAEAMKEATGVNTGDEEEVTTAELADAPKSDAGANMSLVSKYFDGTPRDPEEVMGEMDPLVFETKVETALGKKFNKILTPLAILKNQTLQQLKTSGEGVRWVKDFLAADYAGDNSPERAAFAALNGWDLQKVDWAQQRRSVLGRDEAKITWLKGQMLGLTPKAGVTPDSLLASSKVERASPRAAKLAKLQYDARTAYTSSFLAKGYQPELANQLVNTLLQVTNNFAGLDNAEFRQLTDKQDTANKFMQGMTALGVHVPTYSTIAGKPVLNSIVAVAMQDYIDNQNYAAFNGFLKVSVLAHEQFHAFVKNVVDNPAFSNANADTLAQIAAVKAMRQFSSELTPEDRVRVASTLVDAMVPPKFTRGQDGTFRPEVKALIAGATRNPEEFVAFYYQVVATGLASRIASSTGKQGVAQNTRVTSDVRDAMMWLTKDEQSFIRGQFRQLGDMLEALQQTLDNPEYRASQGYVTTEKEVRKIEPRSEDVQLPTDTFAEGDATQVMSGEKPGSKVVKTTYTRPPTASVGTTAVELAKAAQKVAQGQQGGLGKPAMPAKSPSHFEVVKKLAEVDLRVAKAEAMLQSLEVNLNTPDMWEAAANGTVQSIDVGDLPPIKEFMLGFSSASPADKALAKLANQGWNGKLPGQQGTDREAFLKRWFSPMQYRTADLSARGIKTAEQARQVLGDVQPTAHLLNHSILDGITSRFGPFGDVKVDTTKTFFQFINNGKVTDPNARKALNNIIAKQQELKGVPVGHQSLQAYMQQELSKVAPPKRGLVTTAVQTVNDAYSQMRALKVKSAAETQRNIIASLAMKINPGKLTAEQAKDLGTQAMTISETGNLADRMTWMNGLVQGGMAVRTANALLGVAAAGYTYIQNYNNTMLNLGQFASEQRVGPFTLSYKDAQGVKRTEGILDEEEGKARWGALLKQGASDIRKTDLRQRTDDALALDGDVADSVVQMAKDLFDKQVAMVEQIDPQLAQVIEENYDPAAEYAKQTAVNAVQKGALQRKMKPGRESVDYVETMLDQAQKVSTALARRAARQNYQLLRTELEQAGHTEITKSLDMSLNEVMAPSMPVVDRIKAMVVAKYLVKPASAIVEGMQMLSTGNSMLLKEGLSPKQISNAWMNSIDRGVKWKFSKTGDFTTQANAGAAIERIRQSGQMPIENKDASIAFALQRMNDEGRLGYEPLLDVTPSEDTLKVNLARATKNNEFLWQDTPKLGLNFLYQASKNALRLYGVMPKLNNWLAAGAALETGYEKGLRGDELQSYALGLKDRMAVAGGRENKPQFATALADNKVGRPAVALASLMSSYGLGMITMMTAGLKQAMLGAPGLKPPERMAAWRSARYALGVQLALAGGLGLPGVGAMLYLTDVKGGADLEVGTRSLFSKTAELLGADHETGNVISDTMMNGLFNTLTGADFAARTGVGNIFGVNGSSGFDPAGLLGPIGGVAKDAINAGSQLAQGDYKSALKTAAPDGLKDMVSMFQNVSAFGDNRQMDANGNQIIVPSLKQNVGMALGFKPHSVKQAQQENRLIANSNKQYSAAHDREMDSIAAGIVRQDPDAFKKVLAFGMDSRKNPGFDGKEYIRSIVNRAVDMAFPRDPTASGPTGNQDQVSKIGSLFNGTKPTEVQRLQARSWLVEKLNAAGNPWEVEPPTDEEIDKAYFLDQAMKQRGYTRQQANDFYERMEGNK